MITGSIGVPSKSGGGGGGKMIQKIPLEAGDVFNLVGTWQEMDVPSGATIDITSTVMGDCVYSCVNSTIHERNLLSNAYKSYPIAAPSNAMSDSIIFSYNNQLFSACYTGNDFFSIYRLNLTTLTRTLIATSTFSYKASVALVKQVSGSKILFVSCKGIIEFDIMTNYLKLLVNSSGTSNSAVIQKASNGDYYVGLSVYVAANPSLDVYMYFTESGSLSTKLGTIVFPASLNNLQAIQLGEKLMYVSDMPMAGKHTGELDLINMTLNTSTYVDCPSLVKNGVYNLVEYQNQYIFYSANKKYWLPLLQTPPEENALRLKIFKGQKYNIGYGTIHINALPVIGQEAFELTIHQQIAEKDLYIYDGMYQLFQDQTILIESE